MESAWADRFALRRRATHLERRRTERSAGPPFVAALAIRGQTGEPAHGGKESPSRDRAPSDARSPTHHGQDIAGEDLDRAGRLVERQSTEADLREESGVAGQLPFPHDLVDDLLTADEERALRRKANY